MTTPLPIEEPRELGFWVCTALIVGNTIGMGIFMMPAALAPYGLAALSGWLVTVAGCLTLAWVFSGLARSFPRDDGPYAYTLRAFGPVTAYMVLWCYWVSVWATNATLAVGVVGYLSVLFPVLQTSVWWPPLTALSLIWFFVLLNLRGIRTVSWVQVLTTLLKLLPLLAVMLFGLWLFVTDPAAYTEHVPATPATFDNLMQASTIALFAMLGIECATIPAGRVRDPERTIPRATLAGTLLLAVIYISVSIVPMLLLPQAELISSNAPFADLFEQQVGKGFGSVLAVFVVISGLGALNGWTLMTGELTESFARHGSFPAVLGVVNRRHAPSRAFMLTGVLASVMLLMNYSKSMAAGFTFLSVIVTAANLPLYLACALAVLVLWRRGEIGAPGRREWVLFAAAGLATVYCVWAFVGVGRESLLWALVLAAAGVPVYLWTRVGRRQA